LVDVFPSAVKTIAHALKVVLPPDLAIDAEVDFGMANGGHLIQTRLNVSLLGIEHELA
jgi:hypothetical protein